MSFPLSCKTGESVISWHIQALFSISVDSEKCFSFLGTKGLFAGFLQNVLWVNLAQWAEGEKNVEVTLIDKMELSTFFVVH